MSLVSIIPVCIHLYQLIKLFYIIFQIPVEYTNTSFEERFLMYDSGPNTERILFFSTFQLLDHFAAAENVYGDGTFATCPEIFKQIYVLRIQVRQDFITVGYALLSRKTKKTYKKLFKKINKICQERQGNINMRRIIMDFEKGAQEAALEVFGSGRHIEIGGCFFHLTQSTHRRLQKLQLAHTRNAANC